VWGLIIFGLLYVWFTVMFLPPALLAACAGALYGILRAIPVVWVCAIVSTGSSSRQAVVLRTQTDSEVSACMALIGVVQRFLSTILQD